MTTKKDAACSRADFTSALATYSNHPGAFQDIINTARSNGVVFGTSIASAAAIIPFMVLNYNGVLYSLLRGCRTWRRGGWPR